MKRTSFFLGLALSILTGPATSVAQNPDIALKAYEMRMNGDPHGALALLDSFLLISPDSSRIWFEKGRCKDWVKMEGCTKFTHVWKYVTPRLKNSRRCFAQATRLEPGNARYHYWAAENGALLAMTAIYSPWKWCAVPYMLRRTVNHAENAALLSPDNPLYRYTLITFARFGSLMGGKPKLALKHADTLDLVDPVYGTMARKELESKKHPFDAAARYQELESQYPDHLPLMLKLAQYYSSRGEAYVDQAIHYYRKALEIDSLNTDAITGLGRIMVRHKHDDLLTDIHTYIDAAGSSYNYYQAIGYRELGHYYLLKGDKPKADELNEKAERISPREYSTNIKDLDPPGK